MQIFAYAYIALPEYLRARIPVYTNLLGMKKRHMTLRGGMWRFAKSVF